MPTPLPKPTAPPAGNSATAPVAPSSVGGQPSPIRQATPPPAPPSAPIAPPVQAQSQGSAPSPAPVSVAAASSSSPPSPSASQPQAAPSGSAPLSQPGGGLRMTPPIAASDSPAPAAPVSPIAVAPQKPPSPPTPSTLPIQPPPPAVTTPIQSPAHSAVLPISDSGEEAQSASSHSVVVASPVVTNPETIAPAKPGEIPIPASTQLSTVDPTTTAVITPVVGKPLPGAPQPTPAQTAPKPPQTVTALASVSSNQLPAGAGAAAPPPKPVEAKPTEVEFAKPKRSIFTIIPIIIGIVLIGLVGVFIFMFLNRDSSTSSTTPVPPPKSGSSSTDGGSTGSGGTAGSAGSTTTSGQKVVLQYWGLWEPSDAMKQIIDDYQAVNPNVSVQYTKQSHLDYRTRLQTAVASGNGPDVFRYHASWVPMLKTELSSLPSAVMSAAEFQQTFYPVATKQLQNNGTPVGLPLMYEGLALFYNVDALNTAVVQPPTTWGELRETAKKLTIVEGSAIKRAGIAMGYTSNVDHFSDIVAVLSLQNGADLAKPSGKETIDALTFYTLFAKEKVWDESLPTSTVAFARGDVAMIFAPSWRAHDIKQMNPSLNFATVPVPQLDPAAKVTWANFWAEGVSSKSKNQKEAWEFLKYMSSKDSQQKLYNAQSQTRSFGELYSRVDLASQLVADKVVGSFIADAPKASGWYMSSFTHDKGINDEIIKYYENAINSMNEGKTAADVIDTLSSGVSQVLQKYQVTGTSTTGGSAPAGASSGPSGSSVAPAGAM